MDSLKVDGGASHNHFLMQFQADVLGVRVERPRQTESTALGAAFLAGLAVGYWQDQNELQSIRKVERNFVPQMDTNKREQLLSGWRQALSCALHYSAFNR